MNKRNSFILVTILSMTILATASLTTVINRLIFREGNIDEQSYDPTKQAPADVPFRSAGNNPSEIQNINGNNQHTNNVNVCESDSLSQEPGLEDDLGSDGFVSYQWLRPEDRETLYQSAVFTVSRGNKLCVYKAVQEDPFGSLARCGGLGCDLKQGELVAILEFKPNTDGTLLVKSATGLASFMRGAVCQVDASYLPTLVCRSSQSPASQESDAILVFAPSS